MKIISLEDNTPKVENEREIVIYVKVGDYAGLEQAFKKEEHLQAQIRTKVGYIRIRRTKNADGSYKYDQTTKIKNKAVKTREMREVTCDITQELFEQFLSIAESVMDKTRYCFRSEKLTVTVNEKSIDLSPDDIIYEVDVFKDKDGKVSEWCKIDIEVQKLDAKLRTVFGDEIPKLNMVVKLNQLPFKPHTFILDDESTNADKKALVTEIYEQQFLIHNEALTGGA